MGCAGKLRATARARRSREGGADDGRRADAVRDVAGAVADGGGDAGGAAGHGCWARPSRSMSASTTSAIPAIVRTASSGYKPKAVSPESMTALVAS